MKLNCPSELLFDQIRELHCMEAEIARSLAVLSGSAINIRLRKLLWERALRSRERRDMLSDLRLNHGYAPKVRTCHAIKGILSEGEKRLEAAGNFHTRDLVMIGHCMRIEHAAIITYRIASRLAQRSGFIEEAGQMSHVLSELEAARLPLQSLEGEFFHVASLKHSPRDRQINNPNRPKKTDHEIQSNHNNSI